MSRPVWTVSIQVRLINGQRGSVTVEDDDCVTFRDVQETFTRALNMASQLKTQPADATSTSPDVGVRYPRAV
jgi:hypothetical protein